MSWSLRHKLTVLIVALVLAIATGFELYVPHRMAERGERSVERRAQAVITILASAVTPALDFEDATSAERNLTYLADTSEAVWAVVWHQDGSRFASWNGALGPAEALAVVSDGPQVLFQDDLAIAIAPLRTPSGTVGTLAVAFSLRELHAERQDDQLAVLILCALALIVGSAGAYGIGSVLIRPIQGISVAARRVADGDVQLDRLDLEVAPGDIDSRDEARQLTAAVVDMARRLADHVRRLNQARSVAEAAEERAMAASAAKSNFLANMSHELRTPLNAIIGYVEILAEENDDPLLREDLTKVHSAATHLFGLISGILDIAKIEAGRMDLLMEEWPLPDLVRGVVHALTPLVEKNGSRLICEVAPDVGVMLSDQTKVRQILLNLLSNAAKFTLHGEVALRVRRRVEENGDPMVVMSVSDSGIGMTEEQLSRVFLPFTQADASTTKRFGGTGLGLTLTQRFCEMLGGRIHVESAPDVGSTFTVELPERASRIGEISGPDPSTRIGIELGRLHA